MRSIGCLDCQKKRVDFSSDKLVAYANTCTEECMLAARVRNPMGFYYT